MCFALPAIAIALIGGALSAGGGMINRRAQDRQAADIAQARNDVLRETMAKNDALALENRDRFDYNNKNYNENFDANAAKANADRTAPIEQAVTEAPVAAPISGSAPDVVKSELAKTMADTMAKGKAQAQALGKVGSYGDTWFNAGMGNAGAGRDIGVTNDFAQGNLGIMPYLQDFAQIAATKPIGPLGSIMQGVGSAIGSSGGSFLKAPVPKQPKVVGLPTWGGPR